LRQPRSRFKSLRLLHACLEQSGPLRRSALIGAFSDRETFNLVERAAMLKALAQFGSLAAISLAQRALADSTEDPFVRGSAAFALGALNVRNAIPELLAALSTDLEAIQVAPRPAPWGTSAIP
jgi:HEAT repeat protein